MSKKEISLQGGRSAESVVLIGDTVHRTMGPNYSFIHSLLQYLETKRFPYSPRFLGVDKKGREMLSFLEGKVPQSDILTIEQIVLAIKMLRSYHDAAADSSLCGKHETVCHYDFAPWNILYKEDIPVGMIDFDDAQPGARVDDLAYSIWTFLDLGHGEKSDAEQVKNIVLLANEYQLQDKANLVPAILRQQQRILQFRQHKAAYETDFDKREFSKKRVHKIQLEIQWVKSNQFKIEALLRP